MDQTPSDRQLLERIVARIHDHALQTILALGQDLEELQMPDDPEALERARRSVLQAAGELRAIIAEVHGSEPVVENLAVAVDHLAAQVHRRTGTPVNVTIATNAALGRHPDTILALIREFVTNASLHAYATRIDVTVEPTSNGLQLHVRDDGYGFSVAQQARARAAGHVGLVLAQRRVDAEGGTMTVDGTALGGGTSIHVTLPADTSPARTSPRPLPTRPDMPPKAPRQ